MKLLRRATPLLLLVPLALAGCDDPVVPPANLQGLEPAVVNSALLGLVNTFSPAGEASENVTDARLALVARGLDFAGDPPILPPELQGVTLAYDADALAWLVSDTGTEAPSDGARVVWYEQDGSGEFIVPLSEQGHVDLTPGQLDGADALSAVAVQTAEGAGLTVLDFLQTFSEEGDVLWTEAYRAAGTYADGNGTVTFDIDSDRSGDTAAESQEYRLRIDLTSAAADYRVVLDGNATGDDYDDRLTTRVDLDGVVTVLELRFLREEVGGVPEESVTGDLTHAGEVVAEVTLEGNGYTFATPGGGSFSVDQTDQLNAMFETLILAGFYVHSGLPLLFGG